MVSAPIPAMLSLSVDGFVVLRTRRSGAGMIYALGVHDLFFMFVKSVAT
jgi:hypothetical protein